MIRYLPLLCAGLLLVSCSSDGTTITVDPSTTHQTMEGWGGHVYPQTLPYHAKDPTYEAKMLGELKTTHIRLRSVWYLLEAVNDDDDPQRINFDAIAEMDTGLVHQELILQQLLANRGVSLFFGSWRFPYWMVGRPPDWKPGPDDKPELPADMEDEYIESLTAYLLYARDRYDVVFEGISIANEPDIGIYIKGLSPRRLLSLTIRLRDRLEAADYETEYYLPDVAAADSISEAYTEEFFDIKGAAAVSNSVSFHSYRRDRRILEYYGELGRRHDLPVWVMEQSHTHLAVPDRFDWSHAMSNAVCLHDVLTLSNASMSLYWSYAMASSGGLGLYIPESQEWAPAYHMLKHFYNHVPVGSTRIRTTPEVLDSVRTVAFERPSDTGMTLILINESHRSQLVSITGMSVSVVRVSDRERRHDLLPPDDRLELPPRSVVTVRSE